MHELSGSFRALQHPDLPAIFGAGHDREVSDLSAIGVEHYVSVEDFGIEGDCILKLDGRAIDGVKDRVNFMPAIDDARP